MSKLISMDKKYLTRSGLDVRVLCVDAGLEQHFNVVAIVNSCTVVTYTSTGKYYSNLPEDTLDLVEQPEEKTVWLEIYQDNYNSDLIESHESREEALSSCNGRKLIAIKKIMYKEGDVE